MHNAMKSQLLIQDGQFSLYSSVNAVQAFTSCLGYIASFPLRVGGEKAYDPRSVTTSN